MEVSYLGHSSFRIKGKTATVITDPYDQKMVGLKYTPVSADIVTVSHNHDDHNKVDLVSDVHRVIEGPGEYEVMGVSIMGFPSFHDDKKGETRGKNTIYLFEMDEMRVVHLGDLGHEPSDGVLNSIGDVDVLFVPVGGFYTLEISKICDLVRRIEPKITIPMHYKIEGMNEEEFSDIAPLDKFLSEVGLTVENTDKLNVKMADLTEDMQKVVVLESKAAPLAKK